jgi:phage gp36-like protein
MAYCTADEVLEMLKADMVNTIIGDDYIEDEAERLLAATPLAEEAVADACAEIDGYLGKRYDVPFARTPGVIHKFAKDIALYNLVSRHGIDEGEREKTYLTRYNAAVAFLTKVAEGKIDIGIQDGSTTEDAAKSSFSMRSSRRTFSRDSMRGW